MIPVVIQAGGRGVRMQPITEVIPKPLIPLKDDTIIEAIIKKFNKQDYKEFYIITNYLGTLIEAYLEKIDAPYNLHFIKEKKYGGTAGALKLLTDIDGDFILSNCDIFIEDKYKSIVEYHKTANADITIVATRKILVLPYGVFDYTKDNMVTSIIEKPEYTSVINTGMYVINKKVTSLITREHMDMNELIQKAIGLNRRVFLYHIKNDKYIDIGTLASYKEFMEALYG